MEQQAVKVEKAANNAAKVVVKVYGFDGDKYLYHLIDFPNTFDDFNRCVKNLVIKRTYLASTDKICVSCRLVFGVDSLPFSFIDDEELQAFYAYNGVLNNEKAKFECTASIE